MIVTSDHGENFGEGGLIGHAFSLDQRLTRVPLVLAGPGAGDAQAPISLAELPLLIAEATGVDPVPGPQHARTTRSRSRSSTRRRPPTTRAGWRRSPSGASTRRSRAPASAAA